MVGEPVDVFTAARGSDTIAVFPQDCRLAGGPPFFPPDPRRFVSEPRRIALCITDLDAGGAERALVQIATRLVPLGWSPKVFCLSGPGALVEPLEQAGIPVVCLGASDRRRWRAVRQLTRELRAWRPALVQTFLFHANLAGRWSAWRAGIGTTVCGVRVAERDAPWRMRLDRWTQLLVRKNVCVSQGVADFMVREVGIAAEKVCVIPNGVDFERYAAGEAFDWRELGIASPARVVLFVGRLHPQKGPELLLRALLPRLRSTADVHLVYVGEGPLRETLEERITAEGLPTRVHLCGRREDVPALLRAATCLAAPSRWEGMPNVILEAMAAGCPVVATNVEGSRELIEDGVSGVLCEPESEAGLLGALEQVLETPDPRARFRDKSQTVARENFAWSTVASRYDILYRQLLSDGGDVDK